MTLVRGLEIVVPAGDRRVTSCGAGVAQVRAAAPDAGVVEATRSAGVVRVILLRIDVARQIGAGVDGPEIRDPAVYGPGGGLGLVLVPCRHEGSFLQRLQRDWQTRRRELHAGRELHRHAFRIQALISLLDQDVPLVVDLIEAGQPKALVGDRKSTRLNSSHTVTSYAVFCLKRK